MVVRIERKHFHWAALEIGENGENDTLPYDLEAQFVKERADQLAEICIELFNFIERKSQKDALNYLNELSVPHERMLTPAGSHGFRVTTRIHPFWNLYLNGLAVGIAEINEGHRSDRSHSYRFSGAPPQIFDRNRSWKMYKQATVEDPEIDGVGAVVVQTDISSYYEHIYHHRLENLISDLTGHHPRLAMQIDRFLNRIASGRSFGLPVGGQCARVLAEVMMGPVDASLSDSGLAWHRYVDDFTLICRSQQDAYEALSRLAKVLGDFGLSLNKTKTTILPAKHYKEFVAAQIGEGEDASKALRELDLHFDPYSDAAIVQYEELKKTIDDIDIEFLLDLEREKSQPDTFVLAQISRALKFQEPGAASRLCATLLSPRSLDSFRSSWPKIMRGIYSVRANDDFADIFDDVDQMLDAIPEQVPHLLTPETNMLHFLRALRFKKTELRGRFVQRIYEATQSQSVRRACIDCWRHWGDRARFLHLRGQWQNLGTEEQRMFWIAAAQFGDDGIYAKKQIHGSLGQAWALGIERRKIPAFATTFQEWADGNA